MTPLKLAIIGLAIAALVAGALLVKHDATAGGLLLAVGGKLLGLALPEIGKKDPPSSGDSQAVSARPLSNRPPGGFDAPMSRLRGHRWLPAWLPACILMLLLCAGCSRFARINWGKVEACAPAESALTKIVAGILEGTGSVEAELEAVAVDYGGQAVRCAVEQIVADIGAVPVGARESRKAARGRAFLSKVRDQ